MGVSDLSTPPRMEHVVLKQRYQILKKIGHGATSSVFLGNDLELSRPVAIKVLHQDFMHNDDVRQRFDSETYVTSRLQHPGVVAVFDRASTEDGSLCYMMSLAQGKTLSAYLDEIRRSEFPWQMVSLVDRINLFLKILDVMAYAHSMGVVHRDLKPGNIIVGEHGEVSILDWGLACSLRDFNSLTEPEYLYDQVFGDETRSNHQKPRTTSRFSRRTSNITKHPITLTRKPEVVKISIALMIPSSTPCRRPRQWSSRGRKRSCSQIPPNPESLIETVVQHHSGSDEERPVEQAVDASTKRKDMPSSQQSDLFPTIDTNREDSESSDHMSEVETAVSSAAQREPNKSERTLGIPSPLPVVRSPVHRVRLRLRISAPNAQPDWVRCWALQLI